jgi:hypothetical protein
VSIIVNNEACSNRRGNVTISRSLSEGIYVVDFPALKIQKNAKDEHKTNSLPIYNGSIGFPKMLSFNLLSTMRTKMSFVFENGPVRSSLATKTSYRPQDFKPKWNIFSMSDFYRIGAKEIRYFSHHVGIKLWAIRITKHRAVVKYIRIRRSSKGKMFKKLIFEEEWIRNDH